MPRPESTDLLGPARGLCAACLARPPVVDVVHAAVVYDRLARTFLLRAKLGGRPELFAPLADQLAVLIRVSGAAEQCDGLVPVPSHPWSDLRRGFRPAEEIARRLARRCGLPLVRGLLRRQWLPWGASKRLPSAQRRRLARAAIVCRRGRGGQRLLLVDDVMTTGATVDACAAALKAAGAVRVTAVVWARTLPAGWESNLA